MKYFDDITFLMASALPDCAYHVNDRHENMFSLEYVFEGGMYYARDGGERTVLDYPAVHWHHPQHSYQYGPVGDTWNHMYVTFRGPRGRRVVEEGLMPLASCGYLRVRQSARFADGMERLIAMVGEMNPARHPEAVMLLEQLLSQLMSEVKEVSVGQPYQDAIEDLMADIRHAPDQDHVVTMAAARVGVSVSHFRRLFQRYALRSFHDFVLATRMQRSAQDLQDFDRQIKDIAFSAGYNDPAQFTKLFKSKIGLSPTEYRKALLR